MIKRYIDILNENITELDYYIFDWDDNILMMDTPIYFEKNIGGKWVKKNISAKEFNQIKSKYPKYWENEEWRCDLSKAFVEFQDDGPRGDDALIDDTIHALSHKKYGPSWNTFKNCIIGGNLFAIITTRGHEPETIKRAIEYIIYNELSDIQQDTLIKNLMIYHDAFNEDFEYLIDDYLNNCIFIGVTSNFFVDKFGYNANRNPSKGKKDAVEYTMKHFKKYKDILKVPVKIGFSDDDMINHETIKELFIRYKEPMDGVDFYMFDTSNPDLKGGVKTKL
jgi:hypothetical protein